MIEALGIAMVKNEADVIEAFVRHNLGFMNALAIVDNDSIDGTREILVQLQQEGLPIILFDDPVVAHFHAEIMTAVYRKVVPTFKPRFVFLLDADEFIVASSREALYAQLRAMRPGTQAQYCWRTYIPAPTGPEGDASDPLRTITHRKVVEHHPWGKAVIVTKLKIDMKLKIQQGNHDVRYAGRSLRRIKLRDVAIAHFPVRSVDQITGKALAGWIANLERNRHRLYLGYATHWKALYERIIRGERLTAEDLTREALRYAQFSGTEFKWPQDVVRDPVVPAYSRLTARPTTCTPLQNVARSIDETFDPEAGFSGRATGIEFLQNSNRKSRTSRDFVQPLKTDSRADTELYIDLPPFRHLAQRYCPASVLDIGCGSGAYLKYFASQGAKRIRGVDRFEQRGRYLQQDEYAQVDPDKPFELAETFDLVICVGVVQHLRADSERILISSIARHARERIVFSGACTGKPGADRHIDCPPISRWLDLFASADWYPCLFDSLALRSLSTFPWFRRNLVVFTRDGQGAAAARERLMELERQEIKWNKQRPAVIAHPFTETASTLLAHADSRTVVVANALLRRVDWDRLRAWRSSWTQATPGRFKANG
jgi:SAM-dependent methyltransferase